MVLMFLLCQQLSFATIYGVVKGKVAAEDTGRGLANVIVRLFKGDEVDANETKTDLNGYYAFKNVVPGFYTITFEPPFESGYCSLPYYDPRNTLIIDDQREIYKQLKLEFNLNDGEIKVINKELKKGTKVKVKINIKNTDLEFNPKNLFRLQSKEKYYFEEYFMLGSGYQKVFPVGEKIVLIGSLSHDNINCIDLRKEVEIINTELQIINLDFDFSTTLEVNIIKPLNYPGDDLPSCNLYRIDPETNDTELYPVIKFYGYLAVIDAVIPGEYELFTHLGLNLEKVKWEYNKATRFKIFPGENKITIELEESD
jgi:hypothetical protein